MKSYREIAEEGKLHGDSLLDIFHSIQDACGYLPADAIEEIAPVMGMSVAELFETATFYSYLSLEPAGKYMIRICHSAPCHIAGMQAIVDKLEELLGIRMGETTPDKRFTLQYTGCVGQCASSPVITINRTVHKNLTPDMLQAILDQYQ